MASLKKKYTELATVMKPTADPQMPEAVWSAKRISLEIDAKVDAKGMENFANPGELQQENEDSYGL